MPAQHRPAPSPSDQLPVAVDDHQQQGDGNQLSPVNPPEEQDGSSPDSDAEGCNSSSPSAAEKDEYILVKLADIRREVQCPICLGIIRKTRTVMECLHRFCRECIDKSMRLGNNECPACRTHCASRRSLRDDPNYDAFIATLYPDIDEYEEEELAFQEEEKIQNRKIQESIAEIFRRQTEALGRRRSLAKATAADFVRKSKGNFRSRFLRGRGRNGGHETELICSDEEEEEEEDASGNEDSSTGERSPEVRQKRCKRLLDSWASPVRTNGNSDVGCEDNEEPETSRENLGMCAGHREMLAWGKVAARSQTRHGNPCGFSGRYFKGGRMGKLLEHLRSSDANDNEFDIHLTLLPMDEQSTPLEQPHLCCRPTLSVGHLSRNIGLKKISYFKSKLWHQFMQFIATCTSAQVEQVEILVRKPHGGTLPFPTANSVDNALNDSSEALRILGLQESLAGLHDYFTSERGDLVLLYRLKIEL